MKGVSLAIRICVLLAVTVTVNLLVGQWHDTRDASIVAAEAVGVQSGWVTLDHRLPFVLLSLLAFLVGIPAYEWLTDKLNPDYDIRIIYKDPKALARLKGSEFLGNRVAFGLLYVGTILVLLQ